MEFETTKQEAEHYGFDFDRLTNEERLLGAVFGYDKMDSATYQKEDAKKAFDDYMENAEKYELMHHDIVRLRGLAMFHSGAKVCQKMLEVRKKYNLFGCNDEEQE